MCETVLESPLAGKMYVVINQPGTIQKSDKTALPPTCLIGRAEACHNKAYAVAVVEAGPTASGSAPNYTTRTYCLADTWRESDTYCYHPDSQWSYTDYSLRTSSPKAYIWMAAFADSVTRFAFAQAAPPQSYFCSDSSTGDRF